MSHSPVCPVSLWAALRVSWWVVRVGGPLGWNTALWAKKSSLRPHMAPAIFGQSTQPASLPSDLTANEVRDMI
jgi:hypothetical protein